MNEARPLVENHIFGFIGEYILERNHTKQYGLLSLIFEDQECRTMRIYVEERTFKCNGCCKFLHQVCTPLVLRAFIQVKMYTHGSSLK